MDKFLPTVVIVVVLVLVYLLMLWGWRRRKKRDSSAGAGYELPAGGGGSILAQAETFYVATTRSGEPLERLAIPGLSFRGRAHVAVDDAGVTLAITGEDPVFITAAALSGIGAATVTIDRVVERGGLLRLSWTTQGGVAADSYLRVIDPAERASVLEAVESLLPPGTQTGHTTESEV